MTIPPPQDAPLARLISDAREIPAPFGPAPVLVGDLSSRRGQPAPAAEPVAESLEKD